MSTDRDAPSEMVERVAKAIYEVSADMIENGWNSETDIRKDCWLEDARAAIEATPLGDLIVFYREFKETARTVTLPHSEADEMLDRIDAALTNGESQ